MQFFDGDVLSKLNEVLARDCFNKGAQAMPRNLDCSGSLWLVDPSAMLSAMEVAARVICDFRLKFSLAGSFSVRS